MKVYLRLENPIEQSIEDLLQFARIPNLYLQAEAIQVKKHIGFMIKVLDTLLYQTDFASYNFMFKLISIYTKFCTGFYCLGAPKKENNFYLDTKYFNSEGKLNFVSECHLEILGKMFLIFNV